MALEPSRLGGRRFAAGVAAAAVAGAAAVLGMRPPRPRPADIPASEFSAIRAHRVLAALVGDGVSHPEGSPGAAAIRERIASEFRRIGDVPAVRTAFVCDTWGTCGTVSNVVVERPGEAGRKAVLFSAHYDSVSAGPGASDDGMGVAALVEVARALRAAPLRRPTVFLIDDGEEQGLLGARAFADSREATGILADVNLEARGTSGPSFLFETSEGDRWLARLFSRLPHPATSSLFATIYRAMPNDTDLTVFRAHRIAGINFACIGGVVRYHTPRDDVAHADLRTLQHHGENALAMARALDGAPESADGADAVWFDLLGRTVVGWPASATLPAAILVGVLAAAGTALRLRSPAVTIGRFALGLAAVVATVVAAAAAAAAVSAALRTTGALPAPWVAHPGPAAAAVWAAALFGALGAAAFFGSRASASPVRCSVVAAWSATALVLAARAPGASYPILVPAAIAAISLLASASGAGETLLAAAGGLFLVPLAWTLIEALGFRAAGVIGALLGLLATLFAARWIEWAPRSRRRVLAALAAAAAVAGAAAFLSAAFSRDAPQRATVVALVDGDSGTSRVLVETDADRLPREFAAAAEFRRVTPYPWAPAYSAFASEASRVALPPPELRIEGDAVAAGLRRIRGRLVSPRGAGIVRIAFAPEGPVRGIAIGGVAAPPLSPAALRRGAGWRNYACVTVPAGGIPVEIVSAPGPVSLVIADRSAELPSAAAALAARRGAAAVPSQSGDGTIVFRKLTI